jgi:integrase
MSPFDAGRNPFADTASLTLADVLERVAAAGGLTPRQKREIASAVNSTALWLHRTPAEIPANHDFLRRAFARINFGTLGISRGRVRNVQSLLKQGLATAGVPSSGRSYLAPLAPAWTALREGIANEYARECLARFMRFCSVQGIRPEQVDDGVVEAYSTALCQEKTTARPMIAVQSAVRLWNRMGDQTPGWPHTRLTPLRRRETYTLHWDQLAPDLVADVNRYLAILGGVDPTDPLAPERPLKPLSIRKRRYELLQLISALHHGGERVENLHGLADLCRVDLVRKGLSFYIARHRRRHGDNADPADSTMIGGIADTIRAVAKHYVKVPADVMKELTRIAKRLNRRRTGMSEKNRRRLAQLDSPLVEQKLLSHALAEMSKLAQKKTPTHADAVRYSQLLAIEILLLAPMRIDNLANLDLDQHFVWPPHGIGEIVIVIPRSSVKNGEPLTYKIPAESAAALYTFIECFRPLLSSSNSRALFPGRRHRPAKRGDTISKQIKNLLRNEVGIEWSAHTFRHLAVRIYLREHPGDYEGARRLLAHLRGETTYQTYDSTEMLPAVERLDRIIESIRGKGLFTPPRGGGRPTGKKGKE